MRFSTGFFQAIPKLTLVAACCSMLLTVSRSNAQDEVKEPKGGYQLRTEHIFVMPPERVDDESERVLVRPSPRVDDRIETPTWKPPRDVTDTQRDLPRLKRIWRWIRRDPGLRREGVGVLEFELGEFNNKPSFTGRNSIPLETMEQIVEDIPRSINEKERPMKDMIGETFARGLMNTTMGWMEIPRHISKNVRGEYDPVSGTVVGAVQGVQWTVTRTVVGVGELGVGLKDMLRFRSKRPEKLEHRPLIEPEWIFQATWKEPIPGLNDPHANFDRELSREW